MKVRPCEADRQRFNLPEWCEIDFRNVTVGEMTDLSTRFGFDQNDWPEVLQGQLTLEQAGDPDAVPKAPPWRNLLVAWLLLRQNGVEASWEDAEHVHMFLLEYDLPTPEPVASVGKGQPRDRLSPQSGTGSTTRRSRSSTATSRKK